MSILESAIIVKTLNKKLFFAKFKSIIHYNISNPTKNQDSIDCEMYSD